MNNKYLEYKTNYIKLNNQIGEDKKIQFILFGDVMTGHQVKDLIVGTILHES
jgi:hypothetical protein